MSFTVEQKSQLAKLMATENLSVQHQKIHTAKFDPTNRVLYLPIWQDMSGVLYDLLTGHEVGHALYTPAEGWHDAVADQSKGRYYKNFLNVVEDARIEKKVQRKYPGLRTSFAYAYVELNKRDFFGIKNRNLNEMSFIDRLNFFTKSQYTATWIQFNEQENAYIERIKNLETWEDVVNLTDEIYGYCEEEQQEMKQEIFNDFDYSMDENGEESYDDYGSDEMDDSEETSSEFGGEDSDEYSDEIEEGEDSQEINRFKDSQEADEKFEPRCETDEIYRSKETLLLDEKSKEYLYLEIPKPILSNIVTPWKRVQEQMTSFYKEECVHYPLRISEMVIRNWVTEFKNKNERYVGLLAKEFEMRKAARAFSKSKLSDTGDIDINKLASYKFDDNIFRKVMMTPKGKSHGLVLLLDKSGSMNDNMAGSIEQILVLTMFCRKVNIPFIVYGFGDSLEGLRADRNLSYDHSVSNYQQCFEEFENSIALGSVRLREYLNSKMTNAEFSMAMRNMICLKKSFEYDQRRGIGVCNRPDSESLSNTPLTQAVVAVAPIIKDFKRINNLDMTSLVIVHDGDADYTNAYNKCDETGKTRWSSFYLHTTNVFLRDSKNKYEKRISGKDSIINDTLEWFQKTTGSKVFGFFLTPPSGAGMKNAIHNRYIFEDGETFDTMYHDNYLTYKDVLKSVMKKYKEDKFLTCQPVGYNQFFLVTGGSDLQTEEDTIEIDGKVTASKLKNAFMKFNKKKAVNRVLVSKFIQGIAA
jgi:hypothetical protein